MQAIFIRHLTTDWNAKGWLQGRRDIPISEISQAGLSCISENINRLKDLEPFDAVFTSTLLRTRQTACVYGYNNPVAECLLDELDFGTYEGKPKIELITDFRDKWYNHPRDIILGENLVDFEKRIFDFLALSGRFKRVLVFGHGSWMRALLSIDECGTINKMNQVIVKNNALHIFEYTEAKEIGEDDDEKHTYVCDMG
jgi:broad specificity phosphatase PhoE